MRTHLRLRAHPIAGDCRTVRRCVPAPDDAEDGGLAAGGPLDEHPREARRARRDLRASARLCAGACASCACAGALVRGADVTEAKRAVEANTQDIRVRARMHMHAHLHNPARAHTHTHLCSHHGEAGAAARGERGPGVEAEPARACLRVCALVRAQAVCVAMSPRSPTWAWARARARERV